MLTYLIVSGLCLLLLLHVVCKAWQTELEMHSAAENFESARSLATRGLESFRHKYCHVW
jgi:hypothetical protein